MTRLIPSFLMLLVFPITLWGKQQSKPSDFKFGTRNCVKWAENGQWSKVTATRKSLANTFPGTPEIHFIQVLEAIQKKDLNTAMLHVNRCLDKGMSLSRFVAGPRPLLEALYRHKPFQELLAAADLRLIHGPIIGSFKETSAVIWLRTAQESKVEVLACADKHFKSTIIRGQGISKADDDYTVKIKLSNLVKNHQYYYKINIDGESTDSRYEQSFKTFGAQQFSVIFGGGAGYNPQFESIWNTIASHKPLALLQMGDNVYHDAPGAPMTQRYCYYRRYSRPEFREALASIPVFSIYDDHDFGDNDSFGGPDKNKPAWKRTSLQVFQENFANPAYGGNENNPGCWYRFTMGDVEFYMLDCRYYRDNPRTNKKEKSMLGAEQKSWLKNKLLGSNSKFKIICSSVPMAQGTKPGKAGLDTWDGYPLERQEIFSFLTKYEIDGVFIVSADRHRSDAWKIQRDKGYPIYEFMSSRLTNAHTHPVITGCLFGYSEKCSFGKLNFDMAAPEPSVTYEIWNIDNEKIHSMSLKLNQLTGDIK